MNRLSQSTVGLPQSRPWDHYETTEESFRLEKIRENFSYVHLNGPTKLNGQPLPGPVTLYARLCGMHSTDKKTLIFFKIMETVGVTRGALVTITKSSARPDSGMIDPKGASPAK